MYNNSAIIYMQNCTYQNGNMY